MFQTTNHFIVWMMFIYVYVHLPITYRKFGPKNKSEEKNKAESNRLENDLTISGQPVKTSYFK